jgi:hypothetical protein
MRTARVKESLISKILDITALKVTNFTARNAP